MRGQALVLLGLLLGGCAAQEPPSAPGWTGAKEGGPPVLSEEELFLQNHLCELCHAGRTSYDPATVEFTAEYGSEEELRKDMLMVRGPFAQNLCALGRPLEQDLLFPPPSRRQASRRQAVFSTPENPSGFFLLPIPFREGLAIEYSLEVAVMKSDGEVTAILMASRDGNRYYGADFATVETWSAGLPPARSPPPEAKLQRSPSTWLAQIGGVGMRAVYGPRDRGPGAQVEIFFDSGNAGGRVNVLPVAERSGLPGFSWRSAEFTLHSLSLHGRPDVKEAVRVIKEKLRGTQILGPGAVAGVRRF